MIQSSGNVITALKCFKTSISRHVYNLLILLTITLSLFLNSCASIQQPTGGPKDSIPPKVLHETPANKMLNFNAKQIKIDFDEYVKIKNESKEFSISPSPDKLPFYKIKKKSLLIEFADSLEKNTTYVINLGRGLVDFNEGNILKNYMYVFSTGNKIDSLNITGNVSNTLTKKGVLDATVFLIPTRQDTIFGKKRANIFTTTDSSGNFNLQYLKPDIYRIYALKEDGGDRIYNSSNEEIAFLKDSIDLRGNLRDVKLNLFTQEPKDFKIKDKKIEKDTRILYTFNKKLTKPEIQIQWPEIKETDRTVEFSKNADSLLLWTRNMEFDSLKVAIIDQGVPLDTVMLRPGTKPKYSREIKISDNTPSGLIKPGGDLVLTFSAPVGSIDPSRISLTQDSVPVGGLRILKDTLNARSYIFRYPWRVKREYQLQLDTNAIEGLYGGVNQPKTIKLKRDEETNFGNLLLSVTVPDTTKQYIVQILNDKDDIIRMDIVNKSRIINYHTFNLGKYHFRVVYDDNRNNKWDTGDVESRIQPETTWNSPDIVTLRANWDLEEKLTIPPPEK